MIKYEITDRGFKHYEPLATRYSHIIKVYESSSAMEPCLWLSVELAHEEGGIKPESATAHLSIEQAEGLIERLRACIDSHYQR